MEHLDTAALEALQAEAKIALVATVSSEGLPHVSLLSTLRASSPTRLTWGQFCEGRSKEHVLDNPKVGFAVMNADKQIWRGAARWTGTTKEGEAYEHYNNTPMFRYNAYFGVHTVHELELMRCTEREDVDMPRVVLGTVLATLGAALRTGGDALNGWTRSHIANAQVLKFLCWIGDDGYPVLAPLVPAMPVGARSVVFSPTVYREELAQLRPGQPVAAFALDLKLRSALVRGTYRGKRRWRGARLGEIEVDWVYNTMPPVPGQIYPPLPLEPVRAF